MSVLRRLGSLRMTRWAVGLRRVAASAPAAAGAVTALALALSAPWAPLRAQSPSELAASCIGAGGDVGLCLPASTAGYALMGHSGLLGSGGSPIPGTASNLGTRVAGRPRLAFFGQVAGSSWATPDPGDVSAESSSTVPAFKVGAAAGLFDGFRLMPTVGGVLAVDVFADVTFQSPGEAQGFSGGVTSYAIGIRTGLFREGFTIPGASISLARRFSGSVGVGALSDGDALETTVDPAATSVRATVSKDLFAVEVLAGFGWDDLSADATVAVPQDGGGTITASGTMDGSRMLYFGSASMTFSLVLTLTLEGGWADGLGSVAGYDGPYDPSSGSAFGSLSARLVL